MIKKRTTLIALTISIAFHMAIICALYWINSLTSEMAYGEKNAVVSVDIIRDVNESNEQASREPARKEILSSPVPQKETTLSKKSQPKKEGTGSVGEIGTPGAGGSSNILSKIRAKLESAKHYPRLARKMGLTGRPTVVFEINPNGSIKYVKLSRSSGEKLIDNAALTTVKNAAPLPYYKGPITTALRYDLK